MSEIDCTDTNRLICPYCGAEQNINSDSYEDGEWQCRKCQREFLFDVRPVPVFTSETQEMKIMDDLRVWAHSADYHRRQKNTDSVAKYEKYIKRDKARLAELEASHE